MRWNKNATAHEPPPRSTPDSTLAGAFQATFEQAAVGISIMSLDGRFVRVNGKCAEILGYQPHELVGVAVQEIQPLEAREENAVYLQRMARGEVAGGQMREKQVLRKDGSKAWVALATSLVHEAGKPSHFVTVVQDISARKQAEDELRRFRVAMDSSADMIFLIDRATMRYIDVNLTACRLLGYTRDELLCRGPHDVLPVSRPALEKAYDEL